MSTLRSIRRYGDHATYLTSLLPTVLLIINLQGAAQIPSPHLPPTAASENSGAFPSSPRGSSSTNQGTQLMYRGGLLTVVASNASLSQIVHEIARQTGMKVTGRIGDDRVFGTYGPGAPSSILSSLLDGSGSNFLLVQNASHVPTELILTPRTAAVTPPNPTAQAATDTEDNSTSPTTDPSTTPAPPPSMSKPQSPTRTGPGGIDMNPAATAPSSTSQQIAFPAVDASTPPATTTPTSSDPSSISPKTPQQIFEQLQKLRQQKPQDQR